MEFPFFSTTAPATTTTGRAEALRWLAIAEKLLTTHDLVGSRSFAARARESDPTLLQAEQILAVVDTLIAGEKRIGNNNQQQDWYSILQVPYNHASDSELIAGQYRKLALLLNPQKTKLPFADQAFRLVVEAWSVLSNPSRKLPFDKDLFFTAQPDPEFTGSGFSGSGLSGSERDLDVNNQANLGSETRVGNENENANEIPSFWTACPYCFHMYEYPSVYEDCSLRCQTCKRAFHALVVPAPPPISEGKDEYFCSWGFLPMGLSMDDLGKLQNRAGMWTPFSPMFAFPGALGKNGGQGNGSSARRQCVYNASNAGAESDAGNGGGSRGGGGGGGGDGNLAPRIYVGDEDVYVEVSDGAEESDEEWSGDKRKKRDKSVRGKETRTPVKKVKRTQGKNDGGGNARNSENGDMIQDGSGMPNPNGSGIPNRNSGGMPNSNGHGMPNPQGSGMPNLTGGAMSSPTTGAMLNRTGGLMSNPTDGEMPNPSVSIPEPLKKVALSNARRQGRATKDFGRLDLNVEFSNEVEEPASGLAHVGAARGEEDNIEGISFFEGLDEFLSSLPILNVVGADKVKAS